MAPTGRGAEPQVLTMVPSATLWPSFLHFSAVRRTSISTLSMRKCYRNPAPSRGGIRDRNARAVTTCNFAHDCQAQAAAGARRPRHAVKALQHAPALCGRDAGPVILDFDESGALAPAGAHRDAGTALRILERVVHEVGKRLAQQERIALDLRRLELETKIDVAREGLVHPGVGLALDQALQVERREADAHAGLGASERQQLVGEATGADGGLVHALDLRAARLGQRLRQRELGMRLQAGE